MTKPWEQFKGQRYGQRDGASRARKAATSTRKPQKESLISRKLKQDLSLQMPGSTWWKNAGSEFGEAGLPDLMGVFRGRLIGIEVKQGSGWFRPLQIAWLRKAERSEAVMIGMLFKDDKVYIIPTTAMGHKGDRKREQWVEVDYPDGLGTLVHWKTK